MAAIEPVPVRMVPIEQLLAHPDNWKQHPEEQLAEIRSSLERYGWVQLCLWNERTGRLLNGHARVQVAPELGYTEAPCWVVDRCEADERRILLEFGRIPMLAESDPLAQISLVSQILEVAGELPLGYDLEDLQALHDLVEGSLPEQQVGDGKVKAQGGTAAVRALTLVFSPMEYTRFQGLVTKLQERWDLEGVGRTVAKAVRRVCEERGTE